MKYQNLSINVDDETTFHNVSINTLDNVSKKKKKKKCKHYFTLLFCDVSFLFPSYSNSSTCPSHTFKFTIIIII